MQPHQPEWNIFSETPRQYIGSQRYPRHMEMTPGQRCCRSRLDRATSPHPVAHGHGDRVRAQLAAQLATRLDPSPALV